MNMTEINTEELMLALTQRLLDAIATGDLETYKSLVDDSITCFDCDTCGHLVEGRAFLEYSLNHHDDSTTNIQLTMVRPHVRMLGQDAAVVSYACLRQAMVNGAPDVTYMEVTQVWQRSSIDGEWKCVHCHQSAN